MGGVFDIADFGAVAVSWVGFQSVGAGEDDGGVGCVSYGGYD